MTHNYIPSLNEKVRKSLNNALENGYAVTVTKNEALAEDMLQNDNTFSENLPEEILPYIVDWKTDRIAILERSYIKLTELAEKKKTIDIIAATEYFAGTMEEQETMKREAEQPDSETSRHYYQVSGNQEIFCYSCLVEELAMVINMAQRVSTDIKVEPLVIEGFMGQNLYATTILF